MSIYTSRALSVVSGALALLASLIFSLSISRKLPPEDLAILNIINFAYSIGISIMSYAVSWYPRILSKDAKAYGSLFAIGLLLAGPSWASAVVYLLAFKPFELSVDPIIFALLGLMLILYVVPARAYLYVYKQSLAMIIDSTSQLVKIVGALVVRLLPTIETVLLINIAISIPPILTVRARPIFRGLLREFMRIIKGSYYQTLSLVTTSLQGLLQYIIIIAGGATLMYYNFLLFQLSKISYPANAISSLMYASLLTAEDKEKRKRMLVDGAIILFLYLIPSALMLKAPEVLLSLIRPQEINNTEFVNAIKINTVAFLLSGIYDHASKVLLGIEAKEIFTLRDKPTKALMLDIALFPVIALFTYITVSKLGVVGLVVSSAANVFCSIGVRLYLIPVRRPLIRSLYLPTFIALGATVLLPPLPLQLSTNVITALITVFVYALYITIPVVVVLLATSQTYRYLVLRMLSLKNGGK